MLSTSKIVTKSKLNVRKAVISMMLSESANDMVNHPVETRGFVTKPDSLIYTYRTLKYMHVLSDLSDAQLFLGGLQHFSCNHIHNNFKSLKDCR